MVNAQKKAFNSVISSKGGLHLSAYLENTGNLNNLRIQIEDCLETAREILRPVIGAEELRQFLMPLMLLKKDSRSLKSFSGNVGFFRTETWSRTLNLPVKVEPLCVVADTFHTKPLLRWMQHDQEFLLLHISDEYASLFWGNLTSFDFIDSIPLHRPIDSEPTNTNTHSAAASRRLFVLHWLNTVLEEMGGIKPRHLFIGSQHQITTEIVDSISHRSVILLDETPENSAPSMINFYCNMARNRVQSNLADKIATLKIRFALAEDRKLTETDVKKIAMLAAEDRIETLFVAGDTEVYGRIDDKSGAAEIHPMQIDHLDDDILDDIAQIAQNNCARVVVLEQDQMPGKASAAAILKPEGFLQFSREMQMKLEKRP